MIYHLGAIFQIFSMVFGSFAPVLKLLNVGLLNFLKSPERILGPGKLGPCLPQFKPE